MRKIIFGLLIGAMSILALTGCGSATNEQASKTGETTVAGSMKGEITVVSREDGSGTRGAFIELFGIEEKDASGTKMDMTTDAADITNSTEVMMTSVSQNPSAIGYISLGSLNDKVKALKIDGADATVENIKSGSYKISRPFNIATKGDLDALTQDFIDFILSKEGQEVVEATGYISAVDEATAYVGSKPSGKITIAGSSSVSPVMEKLIEAYKVINKGADIELQTSDSTTGMNSAVEGVCNIGMASRELKDSELEKGLKNTVIAVDGIAIIASKDNTFDGLTKEQVKGIYVGDITDWSDIK